VLSDLSIKTEILCPFCGDDKQRGNPGAINAVYDLNENGLPFIYCSSCESRGQGVSGKGIYNAHPSDIFIQNCLERGILVFRDAERGDLLYGLNKINPKTGATKWGYRKLPNMEAAKEILAMHGMDKPPFIPHFTFELQFELQCEYDFEKQFVNKYVPSKYLKASKPKTYKKEIPYYIDKVLNHVFADDNVMIKHYINDLADLIQTRKKRITAFLLQGTEGTGKGLYFNQVIKPIIGPEYCSEMDQGGFLGNFNAVLEDNVMTLINECNTNFTNTKNVQPVEKIKIAITDERISIERKGKDRYNGNNNTSFMFASNRLKSVVLSKDDRRFNVATRQEIKIENTQWWPKDRSIEEKLQSEIQQFV